MYVNPLVVNIEMNTIDEWMLPVAATEPRVRSCCEPTSHNLMFNVISPITTM